jgi:hypothetical protein
MTERSSVSHKRVALQLVLLNFHSASLFSFLDLVRYRTGIKARLTAPPELSRPATPLSLLAPRHPPHALTSLAAPPPHPTPPPRGGGVGGATAHQPLGPHPPRGPGRRSGLAFQSARVRTRPTRGHATTGPRQTPPTRHPRPEPDARCFVTHHVVKDQH